MKGFAPLLIIIIAVAVISAGIGGYIFVVKEKKTAPPVRSEIRTETPQESPEQPEIPEEAVLKPQAATQEKNQDKLLGLWKVTRAFVIDQKGEFKETVVPFPLYVEFKKGQICRSWEIKGDAGQCKEYQPVIIQGNIIDVRDPVSPAKLQWNFIEGKLELIEIELGTNKPKTKTISEKATMVQFTMPAPQAPTPGKIIQDPKLLLGLWKLEKVLGYDPQDGMWKENQGTIASPYQEFTDKTLCLSMTDIQGSEPAAARFKCLGDSSYAVSGDVISFELSGLSGAKETAYYRWNIVGTKLELAVGIADNPFLKYIYVSAPVSWPVGLFSLELSDTNSPQKGKPFKVQGGRKTTETINMWLTDGAGNILSAEIESFWCSTLGVQSDICITEPSGRADYSPYPSNPQCPFPEIPFGSHPQIGQAVCFVPKLDGQFQIELLIQKPGTYILHAKAIKSGIEAKLPITIN